MMDISRVGFFVAAASLVAMLGCQEDFASPTAPEAANEAAPALATSATALAFYQLSAGLNHSCGVTADNQAYCWGNNSSGQLGTGTNTGPEFCDGRFVPLPCSKRPVAVAGGLRFHQISAGQNANTCGVTTDFVAYCWGANLNGVLGDGTETNRSAPVPVVAGGLRFTRVDVGIVHACAVSYPENRAYCWGSNSGTLGDGTTTVRHTPVAVAGGLSFREVSVGWYHTCGVTTGNVAYCWGANYYGQIGDSTDVGTRTTPTRVAGGRQFRKLDAGGEHTCAVTTGHRAYCWGNGRQGQIGNGKAYLSFWPRAVAGGLFFDRVTAGFLHTCGETTGDRAYCWGSNDVGQLGDGTTTQRRAPVAVAGGLNFGQLSAGNWHTCGKRSTNAGYCWGDNLWAELGDGTDTWRKTPRAVAGP